MHRSGLLSYPPRADAARNASTPSHVVRNARTRRRGAGPAPRSTAGLSPEARVRRTVVLQRADAARNAATPSAVDGTVWYSVSASVRTLSTSPRVRIGSAGLCFHPQTSSAVCFFGEGPRARRGERVASLAFSLITLILLVRFVCMAERRTNAPNEWRAGDDVRASERDRRIGSPSGRRDPRHRADAVSQGNVASTARVFNVELCVCRRA